jgi:1,2-dihydroxy-3-keto-5-methylthiopentene dioxygenase
MSRLRVYAEDDPARLELDTSERDRIAATLQAIPVRFERWQASELLPRDVSDAAVIHAYRADIERLKAEGGYQAADVVRCLPDNRNRQEQRRKFLDEHVHDEDEVRFFVEGAGVFFLRAAGKVHALLCERGDLLGVPAGTRHWFDMGPAPRFTVIRIFTNPNGWVARFTGDRIAERFPVFETLQA